VQQVHLATIQFSTQSHLQAVVVAEKITQMALQVVRAVVAVLPLLRQERAALEIHHQLHHRKVIQAAVHHHHHKLAAVVVHQQQELMAPVQHQVALEHQTPSLVQQLLTQQAAVSVIPPLALRILVTAAAPTPLQVRQPVVQALLLFVIQQHKKLRRK
jgi:hypothetical protein